MIKLLIDVFLHLFIFLIDIIDTFMLPYCLDKYKTQKMCDEAVKDCLTAFTFVPDWCFTSKMLEKLDNALRANDDILFYDEDFEKVIIIACQRHILAADIDQINLDNDNNFEENNPDTIFHVRLLTWCSKFKKHKTLKKNKRRINAYSIAS